jgi:hypothetical protein
MDKPIKFINKRANNRSGFALLLTLSILAIVISLSSVLVGYMSTASQSANDTKALIQANIFYKDIQNILNKYEKDKENFYAILYSSPIPIVSDSGFDILIDCKPLSNGVNINWLAFDNKSMESQSEAAHKILQYISQQYNISNPDLLADMIIFRIKQGVFLDSEFKERLKKQKVILSYNEFEKILYDYIQKENDTNIIKIPWNRYFVFNDIDKNIKNNLIYGNYISAELISALYDIDIVTVQSDWIEGDDLNTFLNNIGVQLNKKLFTTKFDDKSKCEVYYNYMGKRFKFGFKDIAGEVKDFEFYGRQ